jgi:uncharacterized membrane protein (Fun14 family)
MMIRNTDTLTSISASIGGGFFGGLLIGYALKKVIKMLAVVVGLFLAGLDSIQQADAMKKLPRVQVDDQCEGTPRGPDKCQR